MTNLITVGEKGQIVIPKQVREHFKIKKGTQLLVSDEQEKISLKPIVADDKYFWLLVSETALKKTWDNKYDERWDDVF